MAILSKIIYFGSALLATQGVLAAPARRDSCDFGIATPPGWQPAFGIEWCEMITSEVAALNDMENPAIMIPDIKALYAQANINADPASCLPNVNEIVQDPESRAALTQMKANYPAFGSMDLTPENIQTIYANSINAACNATGVPQDMLVKMVWTESKGHPLVYQGLTQMDYVAWGQMVDDDSSLKNRYMPSDNIKAAAMYLKQKNQQYGGDWDTTYTQHYQDPTAASRAAS